MVTAYHYPKVLPYGIMRTLHVIHPLAAALASVLTLVTPLALVHWLSIDGRTPLLGRSRSRNPWWQLK